MDGHVTLDPHSHWSLDDLNRELDSIQRRTGPVPAKPRSRNAAKASRRLQTGSISTAVAAPAAFGDGAFGAVPCWPADSARSAARSPAWITAGSGSAGSSSSSDEEREETGHGGGLGGNFYSPPSARAETGSAGKDRRKSLGSGGKKPRKASFHISLSSSDSSGSDGEGEGGSGERVGGDGGKWRGSLGGRGSALDAERPVARPVRRAEAELGEVERKVAAEVEVRESFWILGGGEAAAGAAGGEADGGAGEGAGSRSSGGCSVLLCLYSNLLHPPSPSPTTSDAPVYPTHPLPPSFSSAPPSPIPSPPSSFPPTP
ncbi:unnamed protein product [Closterium sp. Naga37s-1]|nr:unnamed protein product [Closterium sp. Naga37s-1]